MWYHRIDFFNYIASTNASDVYFVECSSTRTCACTLDPVHVLLIQSTLCFLCIHVYVFTNGRTNSVNLYLL